MRCFEDSRAVVETVRYFLQIDDRSNQAKNDVLTEDATNKFELLRASY